jgi:hypothetical protein
MNTKVLLLGVVVTAFAVSAFAANPALSPRAQANQIKLVSNSVEAPTVTIAYVDSPSALLSPHAQANQTLVVKGVNNDSNPALSCRNMMVASPKAIDECSSQTTMSGCMKVASLK